MDPRTVAAGLLLVFLLVALVRLPVAASATTLRSPGVLVPLYSHPGSQWTSVAAAKAADPSVPVIAIVNPDSGPGWAPDSAFVQGIENLKSAGVVVLGYVPTGYGTQPLGAVEGWISDYNSWYGVDGIFFDEMPSTSGFEGYYQSLDSFVKSAGMQHTFGNPGALLPASYAGVLDVFVVAESPSLVYASSISGALGGAAPSKLALIMYSVPSIDQSYVSGILGKVGYIYATDQGSPNPYDAISSYFSGLVGMVGVASGQPGGGSITVDTESTGGSPLPGLYVSVTSNGEEVTGGFSPLTFATTQGVGYRVNVSDYGTETFDHWSSGDTTRSVSVMGGGEQVLTAYYDVGASVKITIQSQDLGGSQLQGMWTKVMRGSVIVGSGYTPLVVQVVPGATYVVTADNFATDVFDHWSTGSASPSMVITPSADTQLTAYYVAQSSDPAVTHTTGTTTVSETVTDGTALTQYAAQDSAQTSGLPPVAFVGTVAGSLGASGFAVRYYFRRRDAVKRRA